jgi:hypothetical protein
MITRVEAQPKTMIEGAFESFYKAALLSVVEL